MVPGARVRMVRIIALVVVLSVGTATFSQVAAAQSAPPSPTDAQYEQMLRGAVGPAGDQLVQGLRNLQAGLGIHFGNDALTVAEVRRVGLDPVIEALIELAKLLAQSGQIAGIGFVLAAIFKFWFHKLDPSPVPMIPFVLFLAGCIGWLVTIFEAIHPVVYDGKALLADIAPVLKDAKHATRGGRLSLPAGTEARLRAALAKRGLTGDALDAFTRLEFLTTAVAAANARA